MAKWRRRATVGAAIGGSLAMLEFTLRAAVGLGDPPLYRVDPEVEYLMVPGTYRRFGRTIHVNSAHMRSSDAVLSAPTAGERRLMVLGDSVVHGGSLTDQSSLATELLPGMARELGIEIPLSVCNVSAGSWGPGNLLAFLKRFGTFGCSEAVIILNSGDAEDVPKFTGLDADHPTRRPSSALEDLIWNYGLRSIRRRSAVDATPDDVSAATSAFAELLDFLHDRGIQCHVVFHPSRQELADRVDRIAPTLEDEAIARGLTCRSTSHRLEEARNAGVEPYRDDIHPSEAGQRALARTILDCLVGR